MTLLEAIERRNSVRSYIERAIEPQKVAQLQAIVDQCNRDGDLHLQLIVDEPEAFSGRWARYGKFSGVRNYFALVGKGPMLDQRIGYYGELLVLHAQMLGLNTCWVGLTYSKNRNRISIESGEKLVCVIAVGYGKSPGEPHTGKLRDKVSEVNGEYMPIWFARGVDAALLAPTAMNQQKFTISLTGERTVALKTRWGFFTQVDLGIVRRHFEIGAGTQNFDWEQPL